MRKMKIKSNTCATVPFPYYQNVISEVYAICKRKYKKLLRTKRLIFVPELEINLYINDKKNCYIRGYTNDIMKYADHDLYFYFKNYSNIKDVFIILKNESVGIRCPKNGLFLIAKNKKDAAKLKLMVN